jgi:chromosome partitioning protein
MRPKEPLELMGIAEIATHFGVTRQVVNNWKVRYPHFPKPIARLGKRTEIWTRPQILKWDPPRRGSAHFETETSARGW